MATFGFSFSTDLLLFWLSELNSNSLKFILLPASRSSWTRGLQNEQNPWTSRIWVYFYKKIEEKWLNQSKLKWHFLFVEMGA
jgi:hypothetical protein